MSWIIRNKTTKQVVLETFSRKIVQALNVAKYEAVPIREYLYEMNAKTKEAAQ